MSASLGDFLDLESPEILYEKLFDLFVFYDFSLFLIKVYFIYHVNGKHIVQFISGSLSIVANPVDLKYEKGHTHLKIQRENFHNFIKI